MSENKVIAKRPYGFFDMAMDKIWLSKDSFMGYRYVLFHFMNHKNVFGVDYIGCHNITELNQVKSTILNNGYKIDWNSFNYAMEYLNEN